MYKNRIKLFVCLGIIIIFTSSCGSPSTTDSTTLAPTSNPPTVVPSPIVIQHLTTPGAGNVRVTNAWDNEESTTFEEKTVRVGDQFRINRFERPFTANDMEYLPHIDIMGMSMTKDDTWFYVQIKLAGADPQTGEMSGIYGVEFDLNIDGKTEILFLAQGPLGPDWTTDSVTVYVDNNGDIGGISSRPDDIYTGNGYETIVFGNGQGEDPDAGWARASADMAIVEIAFKQELLRNYPTWMWNPLASGNPLDPTKFYFNDTITEERAGSPDMDSEYYPLNELAAFDNTCRVPAGFEATGSEPMGCAVDAPEELDFAPPDGYP